MNAATLLVIQQKLNLQQLASEQVVPVGGGSINECYRINQEGRSYFCKINSATKFPQLFLSEKKGLQLLASRNLIKTPDVIDCFEADNRQFLFLEWIPEGERTKKFWSSFGTGLARLHHQKHEQFGLEQNNYMGSVEQLNTWSTQWTEFFIRCRLEPLKEKCFQARLLTSRHINGLTDFYFRLENVFDPGQKASLVHGDLWNGNFICNQQGEAVLIDPAAYYGHPSVDLGMSRLFGGFDSVFYEAYHYHAPFPANYKEQWQACNLYPLLIHLLLFGRSYLPQIESTLQQFA